jgi:4-hydroxybenzoate polyprenyltransferase
MESDLSASQRGAAVATAAAATVPLCVDLDGTLLRGDLLHECAIDVLKRSPWLALAFPVWLLGGRAKLKAELARRARIDYASLPFDPHVLELLRREHDAGRKLVLATASDAAAAHAVAAHLGLFDDVIASNGTQNLKGAHKAAALVDRFGEGGFDYLGDAAADRAVWRAARKVYVVCASEEAGRRLAGERAQCVVVARSPGLGWPLLRALRTHQWAKNLLVFVALVTAHRLGDALAVDAAFVAFAAFCLAASGAYLLNDLLDLEHDRRHPEKRRRALASGELPLWVAAILSPLLVLLAGALSLLLPVAFRFELLLYIVATIAYSTALKRVALLDVFTLAGLYCVRILAGAAAIPVPVSGWLVVFSLFLFLSLALVKRYAELSALARRDGDATPGRGYRAADRVIVGILGVTSGEISVLVFALYVASAEVRALYSRPMILWLVCPLLLYWVTRVWLLAYRDEMQEDPVVFALRDRASLALGALVLVVLIAAT